MLYLVFVSNTRDCFKSFYMQSMNHFSSCRLIITLWTNGDAGTGLCGRLVRRPQPGGDSSGIGITQPHAIMIVRGISTTLAIS